MNGLKLFNLIYFQCFFIVTNYIGFPYAPLHDHKTCPELEKINKNKLNTDKNYNKNKTNETNSINNKKIEILSSNIKRNRINELI